MVKVYSWQKANSVEHKSSIWVWPNLRRAKRVEKEELSAVTDCAFDEGYLLEIELPDNYQIKSRCSSDWLFRNADVFNTQKREEYKLYDRSDNFTLRPITMFAQWYQGEGIVDIQDIVSVKVIKHWRFTT